MKPLWKTCHSQSDRKACDGKFRYVLPLYILVPGCVSTWTKFSLTRGWHNVTNLFKCHEELCHYDERKFRLGLCSQNQRHSWNWFNFNTSWDWIVLHSIFSIPSVLTSQFIHLNWKSPVEQPESHLKDHSISGTKYRHFIFVSLSEVLRYHLSIS